jgi:hypothetical protein
VPTFDVKRDLAYHILFARNFVKLLVQHVDGETLERLIREAHAGAANAKPAEFEEALRQRMLNHKASNVFRSIYGDAADQEQ